MNINQSMKDFSCDLENRLDRAYKSGATKKYGYDGIINTSSLSSDPTIEKDRSLQKIVSQAQSYLEKNSGAPLAIKSAGGMFGSDSFSK